MRKVKGRGDAVRNFEHGITKIGKQNETVEYNDSNRFHREDDKINNW